MTGRVGGACTTADVRAGAQGALLTRAGDLLAFENIGAYSVTEGITCS